MDRIVRRGWWYAIAGVFLFVAPSVVARGWAFPATGFALISFGIFAGTFRRWRTEPGLWMLAAFLTLMLGACWTIFEVSAISRLLERPENDLVVRPERDWQDVKNTLDGALGLWAFGSVVRFAASVVVANRRWTGRHAMNHEAIDAAELHSFEFEDHGASAHRVDLAKADFAEMAAAETAGTGASTPVRRSSLPVIVLAIAFVWLGEWVGVGNAIRFAAARFGLPQLVPAFLMTVSALVAAVLALLAIQIMRA